MTHLLVTEQAHDVIVRAVADGQKKGIELGGSLLAVEREETTLVAYALPTGPGADQGSCHLTTDADFQNRALTAVRARRPELVYVGDWHVHPMWLPELSEMDRRTASAILREEASSRDHLVLLLGTAAPGKSPVVLGFRAAVGNSDLSVARTPIRRVDGGSREAISLLGCALAPLEELLQAEAPTVSVAERAELQAVQADLDQIRGELDAEATLWLAGDNLGALVRRGGREAVVVFPGEYPLGAPCVFSGSLDSGPLRPVPLRYGWSSLHRVVDVVAEALEADDIVPAKNRGEPRVKGALDLLSAALAWAGVSRAPRHAAPPAKQGKKRST